MIVSPILIGLASASLCISVRASDHNKFGLGDIGSELFPLQHPSNVFCTLSCIL